MGINLIIFYKICKIKMLYNLISYDFKLIKEKGLKRKDFIP